MTAMIQVPEGRLPLISPDGQTVACGTNQVLAVSLPSGLVTPIDVGGEAAPCGYHKGLIAISKYVVIGPNAYGRQLLNGPVSPDPAQLPGYHPTMAVANNHVVSSSGGQHFIDGQPVTYNAQGSDIETFDGQHFGYKPHDTWNFVVRDMAQQEVLRITDPISNAIVWTDAFGRPWVFANLNGAAAFYAFDGARHQFQQGEFRGCLSDGPTEPWAWTCGQFTDGRPFVYLRPFSDLSGQGILLRDMWWAGLGGVWKPTEGRWTGAGYFDGLGGVTYIDPAVDPNQPREVLDLGNSQPVPVPPDPTPNPPQTITIQLKAGQRLIVDGVA